MFLNFIQRFVFNWPHMQLSGFWTSGFLSLKLLTYARWPACYDSQYRRWEEWSWVKIMHESYTSERDVWCFWTLAIRRRQTKILWRELCRLRAMQHIWKKIKKRPTTVRHSEEIPWVKFKIIQASVTRKSLTKSIWLPHDPMNSTRLREFTNHLPTATLIIISVDIDLSFCKRRRISF